MNGSFGNSAKDAQENYSVTSKKLVPEKYLPILSKKIEQVFDEKLEECQLLESHQKLILLLKYIKVLKGINKNLFSFIEEDQKVKNSLKCEIEKSNRKECYLKQIVQIHQAKEILLKNPKNAAKTNDKDLQVDLDSEIHSKIFEEREKTIKYLEDRIRNLQEESMILCETNKEFQDENIKSASDRNQELEVKLQKQTEEYEKLNQMFDKLHQKYIKTSQYNKQLTEKVKAFESKNKVLEQSLASYDSYLKSFSEDKKKSRKSGTNSGIKSVKITEEIVGNMNETQILEKTFEFNLGSSKLRANEASQAPMDSHYSLHI